MSNRNFLRMRRQGVTGREHPNCFIAAGDRILPHVQISERTYVDYALGTTAIDSALSAKLLHPAVGRLINMLAVEVGLDSWRDLEFERVETGRQLRGLLRKAIEKGQKLIVDIDLSDPELGESIANGEGLHAVGIKHLGICPENFQLKSTWLPSELIGILGPDDLMKRVAVHRERHNKRYPFNDSNITIIPDTR